ncbi:unnamed protein product [Ixodes pacificus]
MWFYAGGRKTKCRRNSVHPSRLRHPERISDHRTFILSSRRTEVCRGLGRTAAAGADVADIRSAAARYAPQLTKIAGTDNCGGGNARIRLPSLPVLLEPSVEIKGGSCDAWAASQHAWAA